MDLVEVRSPRELLGRSPAGVAVGAASVGVALDIGVRSEVTNAVLAAGLLGVIALLLASQHIERPEARALAVAAVVPTFFLVVRASPWLAVANLGALGALVGGAALHAHSGSVADTTVRRLLKRTRATCGRALGLPPALAHLAVGRQRGPAAAKVLRIGRGVLVAFPLLGVVVVLLASGDAVFARLLVPDVSPGPMVGHVVLAGIFSLAVLFTVAGTGVDADDHVAPGRFGAVEVVTMLTLAAGVVTLFVVSQIVASTATGERLLASSGLTPAEYARSGFFQLCWATAVLVAFLGLVRALAAREVLAQRGVRVLAGAVPLLAIGLVAVCLRRMALYDQAFGLTMLRLAVVAVAVWLGLLLVLLGLRNLRPGGASSWVLGASGAVALAIILAADLLDPEAFVVRHNLDRAAAGAELDVSYLAQLSDDAVPTVAAALHDPLRAPAHGQLQVALGCGEERIGVARLNLAVARAAAERARLCGSG